MNYKKKSILFILSAIIFILITYIAAGWQPLGLPSNINHHQVSDFTYKSNNSDFKKISIKNDNSIRLKFDFKVIKDNSFSNIFQTDYLNNGIRLELNSSELSLIVQDKRYIHNYNIYSFKTKIRKNINYRFELLAIKNVGYIVKLNDEIYSHVMFTFKPSFDNFIIGKGYDEKRFFIGEVNNIKNESWQTYPYAASFYEIRKNILYLTSTDIAASKDKSASNNKAISNDKATSNIDMNSFYDVKFTSRIGERITSYLTPIILIFFIGLVSLNKYNSNIFHRSKIQSNYIVIILLLTQTLLIVNYSFYSYFIASIFLLYIFGYIIFKYLFPDFLKDQISFYIFPPMFGLLLISTIGGYSIALGFDAFLILSFIAITSFLFILKNILDELRTNSWSVDHKDNFYKILCFFSLLITPTVFMLLYPLIINSDTSFIRIGPDMFFYAKMAQFIHDGGLLEFSRLRMNEFEGLSTGDINKYSDATASWPFMYFYRWGLGFYQHLSIIISSSKHAYEVIFTSLVIPYIFLSSVVFYWLYKKIKLSLYLSLLGFIAFVFNTNMINIWYEGFYANIYSLFMFAVFLLIFSFEKNFVNRSKIENVKSIALYTIILISIIMSYPEGLFFIFVPFVFLILAYDYLIKKDFNYLIYKNLIISGILAILFVLPCSFFIEWAEAAINQVTQEGGNGYMQPKWALPNEVLGFNNIYHDISLTNGGQRIGRIPIDWIYSLGVFYLFFIFYYKTIKQHFKKINSIYAVSHILIGIVGVLVIIKSRQNNYLYMKYYIFLLPYLFLFFWEYIGNFEFSWKNKKYYLLENKKNILLSVFTILIVSSGVSYIVRYSDQANFIPKNQIELYASTKNIDFSQSIIYPLRYKKYLNAYPAIIKSHFISPAFESKHAKNISSKKVYILIEKYKGEKYFYENKNIIFENSSHIIIDSGLKLKNFINKKTKKIDFTRLTNMLTIE